MSQLIPEIGADLHSKTSYAQTLICVSAALTWGSLAGTKMLHGPRTSPAVHYLKVG